MPFVENQGAKLYWDEQGSGEPLLLIMGLSYPSYMWHRSRTVFANSYRTIALDNRGVGQSDVSPLTISDLRIWLESFAKSLCPALKGYLPVWRTLFGLGLQADSSTGERC